MSFILGAVVGGVIMTLVYRNNKKKFDAIIEKLKKQVEELEKEN
jgi:uncharacterized membrane-anchored protein YhcB (DUF1043 family)